jgi:hypothetical protein
LHGAPHSLVTDAFCSRPGGQAPVLPVRTTLGAQTWVDSSVERTHQPVAQEPILPLAWHVGRHVPFSHVEPAAQVHGTVLPHPSGAVHVEPLQAVACGVQQALSTQVPAPHWLVPQACWTPHESVHDPHVPEGQLDAGLQHWPERHTLDPHWALVVQATHWLVDGLQTAVGAWQSESDAHPAQMWVEGLHAGVLPEHWALLVHATQEDEAGSQTWPAPQSSSTLQTPAQLPLACWLASPPAQSAEEPACTIALQPAFVALPSVAQQAASTVQVELAPPPVPVLVQSPTACALWIPCAHSASAATGLALAALAACVQAARAAAAPAAACSQQPLGPR